MPRGSLPIRIKKRDPSMTLSESLGAEPTAGDGSKGRVAIVDDDPRIRRLLQDELRDLGYGAASYDSAFDLLEHLESWTPAVVLLDLLMPQMDGIECLRRIRESGYTGAVIIFTALSDNDKRNEAQQEGATEYVLKPDLFENLEQIITRYL